MQIQKKDIEYQSKPSLPYWLQGGKISGTIISVSYVLWIFSNILLKKSFITEDGIFELLIGKPGIILSLYGGLSVLIVFVGSFILGAIIGLIYWIGCQIIDKCLPQG